MEICWLTCIQVDSTADLLFSSGGWGIPATADWLLIAIIA